MQIRVFARIAQSYAVRVSEIVRKRILPPRRIKKEHLRRSGSSFRDPRVCKVRFTPEKNPC
jgi:hypothetical protein